MCKRDRSCLVIAKMEEIRKVYEVYVSPQVQQSAWLLLGLYSDEQKLNVNVNLQTIHVYGELKFTKSKT